MWGGSVFDLVIIFQEVDHHSAKGLDFAERDI